MEEKKSLKIEKEDIVSKMDKRENRIRGLNGNKSKGQGEITKTKFIWKVI